MIVDLDKVPPEGDRYIGSESPAVMDLSADEGIEVFEGLRYDVDVYVAGRDVLVRGRLELDVAFRCSRCAEFFRMTVREPDFECSCRPPENRKFVDLTEDLREAILLAFPSYPVCGATCKGLCSRCGRNLNEGPCACQPPLDERWGALNGLQGE